MPRSGGWFSFPLPPATFHLPHAHHQGGEAERLDGWVSLFPQACLATPFSPGGSHSCPPDPPLFSIIAPFPFLVVFCMMKYNALSTVFQHSLVALRTCMVLCKHHRGVSRAFSSSPAELPRFTNSARKLHFLPSPSSWHRLI